jgi:large subunit ribosomal protein L17
MRHGRKVNHLSRQKGHREALLSNLANSLILSKRITTTVAKAKALRKYVEPLITKAKDDTTHSRRTAMSYLQNKEGVRALFGEVAGRIGARPGGYTRIIKLGDARLGDNAEMCLMELVDFNEIYKKDGAEKKGKTRRSRGKGKKEEGTVEAAEKAPATEKKKEDKPKAEKESKPAKKKGK